MADRLGIVYTPIEVVDFILSTVEAVLFSHFSSHLTDQGVHIIDPFCGTGTFLKSLLNLGLINPQMLEHKFKEAVLPCLDLCSIVRLRS